ncbi:uncharacterized protein A4U43_C09F14870 [Asparagus officinalis]|uniref:Uncharacterized protein n=1 Tax=Asparagus officinalis TaxID=4686 RepID=A0A5P1E7S4_ASPOF|nr:tetratricopeptide repeat protein 27 homolog [Asparagus officinalis]XP_020245649.1 tetratricopeptide repeat protein 27 homolog [Asparagus officinalis]XP_020245650.1 tetratricopeptide repeat protein 27 homolog [Asparagus officinalis]ONK58614.1 uncharacterized protein A4U43_C09F14870 [Asparagus officinalis]
MFLRNNEKKSASETWLSFLDSEGDGEDSGNEFEAEFRFAVVLCLGVAALLAFMQQNVTGPVVVFSRFPLSFPQSKMGQAINGGGMWDIWARSQLMSVGCGLLGKFTHLQYIVYGKILLSKAKDLSIQWRDSCLSGTRSISWWLCRLILLQQRILDELSSSLYDLLQVCKKEILNQFGELDYVINYWGSLLYEGEAAAIVSMAQLEAGILEYKYARVDSLRLHLERAEEACGMHHSVTGVLGFRTIHQVDPTAQLVLVPNTKNQVNGGRQLAKFPQTTSDGSSEDKMNTLPQECSDVLIKPRLVESRGQTDGNSGIGNDAKLTAIQQAVILAQCLHLQTRGRNDELSKWEMAPYIEAIDSQHQSFYIIRCLSNILRVRWESSRSHTKERAFLMMDKLVEAIKENLPMVAQRIQVSFAVYLPTIPALRKEYGELLVSCGMIGEALKTFEDLELWDNLIFCYRLLDKKAAAVDLIKARLVDMPTDPRLWCSLGDVTNNDAYYEKALEVSDNKSARAKRSLARSAYNRGDYETSKILWESALAINSLFQDGWFALGAAALKAGDYEKALDGFTHAVQLDPENGEAWNNIAFLHMRNKKSKPAFIAFKEALKFRRNTWQLWENYSHVAIDIGNFTQALEAIKQVLDLSNNKRVDVELLDVVMRAIEENASETADSAAYGTGRNDEHTPQRDSSNSMTDSCVVSILSSKKHDTKTCPGDSMIDTSEESAHSEQSLLNPREIDLLMNMLGGILAQIVKNGGVADIWGLYARWHKIKGDLLMCSEALLKEVRSYQGSDLWHDQDRFKKFAHASLQLCKVYMEIASSSGSRRELTMAEMHLRNSVKQAVKFTDTEEFQNLQAYHEEVKRRLSVISDGA